MEMKTSTACLVTAIATAAAPALAQEILLGDVKAKGGAPLTKDELNALIPGATVYRSGRDADANWSNQTDGKLIGSSQGRTHAGKRGTARGSWRVTDDGKYCVDIEWDLRTEQWCRVVYRHGDDYVAFRTAEDPGAKGMVLTIRK
jgi:hypothetical protein